MRTISRRHALKLLAACSATAAAAPLLRPVYAASLPSLAQVHEERILLGTIVGITALAPSPAQAQDAMEAAFATVRRLEGLLSRYNPATPLADLNRYGHQSQLPQEILTVVHHGMWLHRATAGHFDMTVAPVVDLLERTHGAPDPKDLTHALELVGTSRMAVRGRSIRLDRGMSITLDGIAKGYIADLAAQTLRQHGVDHFLVDAGGDIFAQGSPEGHVYGRPWKIAIEDPDKNNRYPATTTLRCGAIATSGGYERPFGHGVHHLIAPTSGHSSGGLRSVSVKAPTTMQADGLATALAVMTPREALHTVAALPEYECLVVTPSGSVLTSPGWNA